MVEKALNRKKIAEKVLQRKDLDPICRKEWEEELKKAEKILEKTKAKEKGK